MEEKVYRLFDILNIPYKKIEHPAFFSCNDIEKYNINFDGIICKNLFIQNSNKSQYYLIVLPVEKKINLKELQKLLNESRLSFASKEVLEEKLKIKSGAVSILNIINIEATDVIFIIDKSLLSKTSVCFHPNVNTATVIFDPIYINNILNNYKVTYIYEDL